MTRPAFSLALRVALVSAVASGCSGRSVVIGGDPFGEGDGSAGGGTLPVAGGAGLGGSFSSGGSGGTTSTGFGGSSLLPIGGNSATGGDPATGGEGGIFDPYPPVAWEVGPGYRRSCPHYDEIWGFTCWNFEGETRSCKPSDDPYCNACSCAVPCEDETHACPPGVTGHPAVCVSSPTTMRSCFLSCDDGRCPTGMACSRYPGADRQVCVWISEPPRPPL